MKFCLTLYKFLIFFPFRETAWVSRDLTIFQIPLIVFGISFIPKALVEEKKEESDIDALEERKEERVSE